MVCKILPISTSDSNKFVKKIPPIFQCYELTINIQLQKVETSAFTDCSGIECGQRHLMKTLRVLHFGNYTDFID